MPFPRWCQLLSASSGIPFSGSHCRLCAVPAPLAKQNVTTRRTLPADFCLHIIRQLYATGEPVLSCPKKVEPPGSGLQRVVLCGFSRLPSLAFQWITYKLRTHCTLWYELRYCLPSSLPCRRLLHHSSAWDALHNQQLPMPLLHCMQARDTQYQQCSSQCYRVKAARDKISPGDFVDLAILLSEVLRTPERKYYQLMAADEGGPGSTRLFSLSETNGALQPPKCNIHDFSHIDGGLQHLCPCYRGTPSRLSTGTASKPRHHDNDAHT